MGLGNSSINLRFDPNELCQRLKLSIQEQQAGINYKTTDVEIIALVDILSENKCISTKQHKQFLTKCNLLQMKKKKV